MFHNESVCGIIEVKRTLTKEDIRGSENKNGVLDHLAAIIKSVGRSKDCKTDKTLVMANAATLFHNHSSNKPLLAVVGLKNEMDDMAEVRTAITTSDSLVDFVWTLDGHALLPGYQNPEESNFCYYAHTAKPETLTGEKLTVSDFQSATSKFYTDIKVTRPETAAASPAHHHQPIAAPALERLIIELGDNRRYQHLEYVGQFHPEYFGGFP